MKKKNTTLSESWFAILLDEDYQIVVDEENYNPICSNFHTKKADAEEEVFEYLHEAVREGIILDSLNYRVAVAQVSETPFLVPETRFKWVSEEE